MKWERRIESFWKFVFHYLTFFLLVAFVTTSCMALFVSTFSQTLGLQLTGENLSAAAKLTFGNVLLISLLFTLIDTLRRKYTVRRPVKRIVEAASRIMQGDFSVRIAPCSGFADDTFQEICECFNRMAQELQGVETLRTDFIADVSHELKTPLAVLQNYAVLLQDPGLSGEKRQEYARSIAGATRRMSDMITNILKLNRLENQQIFPEAAEFDLGEQLCECLLQYESVWETAGIELETEIAEDISIHADAELLKLVWSNLFSNAFKFTPPGGTVSVSLAAEGDRAVVRVADTGCGMNAEVGAHIFEKFYQGDPSHAAQGNGLGLALVKRVVDILHGEIGVESALGAGTLFTVRLGRE